MVIYIGIDDTDNDTSRGTGRLARQVAAELGERYPVLGVTRHQLLVAPGIPYTSHNSSATILIRLPPESTDEQPANSAPASAQILADLFDRTQALMLADFQPGSDPGLCVADAQSAASFTAFGKGAQSRIVTQAEARSLAESHGVRLAGLGGSQDGVIGALAAVGLAASGEDGRYLLVGRSRGLAGLQSVEALSAAGVPTVLTLDGHPVQDGLVLADKLRPARRGGQPVLFVEWQGDRWLPLKLD